MAGTLAELEVNIIGNTKSLDTAIDGSKKTVDKFDDKLNDLSKTVKKLLGAGALIAVAKKIADLGTASINAASDAEEANAKFNTAFDGIVDRANETATALKDAYGLSQTESEKLLGSTGDLLKGFGATADEALDFSAEIQKLAVDLASYNNVQGGASRVSNILTKSVLGNKDGLSELGVSLLDVDIKQELVRTGQDKLTGQAGKLAKAQATYNLILQQTGDAQGDFARTSDSYANQLKVAKARTADLQVELGRSLLPTATKGVGIFGTLTGKLGEYLKGLNDIKEAEEAQKSGIATQEQELAILENKLTLTQKDLANQKKSMEATDARLLQAGIVKTAEEKAESLLGKSIASKERQVTGISRAIDALRVEIKAEQDLQEELKKEDQIIADKAETERQAAEARVIQKNIDLDTIDKIIEANKSEIDVINEQIEQLQSITDLTETENAKRLESIKILQDEKKNILKEIQGDEDAFLEEQDAKGEEYAQKELDRAKKLKDDKIALRQEEADFVVGIAGSIFDIYKGFNEGQIDSGKKTADEIYDIRVKQFRAEQALALSQIAIDTAIGVAKVYGQTGIFGLAAQTPVIAAGALQAAAVIAQQPPPKPQLATGAIIAGSQRGVDVTVGESGNDELILGGGSKGDAILQRFADKINSNGGGQTVNNYYSSMFAPVNASDMRRFTRLQAPYVIQENQRQGN